MIVAVEILIFSLRGVIAGSTGYLKMYAHSALQYSCLRNGSLTCPPWSHCDSIGICMCPQIPTRALQCDGFDKGNALHILNGNCVTYNEEFDLTEVGLCIYNGLHESTVNEVYHLLPPNTSDWNNDMCGRFNRTVTLCSRCNAEDGFYPRDYSFDVTCIQCTNGKSNWWKFALSAYLPLTLFYFVILCFKISIHSSYLQGYILYSQIIAWPPFVRSIYLIAIKPVSHMTKFLGSLYGIWNLTSFECTTLTFVCKRMI